MEEKKESDCRKLVIKMEGRKEEKEGKEREKEKEI